MTGLAETLPLGAAPDPGVRGASGFSGLLVVDKPAGVTSHDVVVRVRRRLHSPGAGHLGTLDPGASGLLLLALGAATRAIPVWQGGAKTYDAVLRLGVITSTQDLQGEVLERRPVEVDEDAVRRAALEFRDAIDQVPPMVSALKVGGRRLHRLARRGITVERAPRRVTIHAFDWLGFDLPDARFRVVCSGGTYVRTLAHDLGERLGCGAALKTLRRLRSEPFDLGRAVTVRDLDERSPQEVLDRGGIPLDEALRVLPDVTLDEAGAARLGVGARVSVDPGTAPLQAGPRSVVFRGRDGRALALGELAPDPDLAGGPLACPHVVFPWAVVVGRPAT